MKTRRLRSPESSNRGSNSIIFSCVTSFPYRAMEENDVTHEKMIESEPLLKASGERNLWSINLTHGECPCHCLNLCLIWNVEGTRSVGLPDHQQKVTIFVVSSMQALRWIEENVTKYRESRASTVESKHAIDYNRRLESFENACKVFSIPMEMTHVWSRIRFFPWFRGTFLFFEDEFCIKFPGC